MSLRSTMRATISATVVATILSGCATAPAEKTSFGGRNATNVGLATRALGAFNSSDYATAVTLAEQAVEQTPNDAGFRVLLGNAYFAMGRFVSAEQAYKDGLSIYGHQPQALFRLALVQIAQGKNAEAIEVLNASRNAIDAANYGLALALAGQPNEAVMILDIVARQNNADARVRQNLALAHALSGDWEQARIIASQDVPADQLDARLQQWASLAKPERPSDQVAALIGVTPATSDAGQPVRLALHKTDGQQMAHAAAPAAPVAVAEAAPIVAYPTPDMAMTAPTATPAEDRLAAIEAALPATQAPADPAPSFSESIAPPPPPENPLRVAAASPAELPMAMVDVARTMLPKARAALAAAPKAKPTMHKASATRGSAYQGVVQLGAYSSAASVQVAWDKAAKKYAALRDYAPVSARFQSAKGTFYRLSVKGFDSAGEASGLCSSLKRAGRACFVRDVAGDKPVAFAAR